MQENTKYSASQYGVQLCMQYADISHITLSHGIV